MGGDIPAPEHDPALVFRSVEAKFVAADPDGVLQGASIVTDIKQETTELAAAFERVDATKVHFASLAMRGPTCVF